MEPGETALYIGRFQPFHNGHMEVIRQIKEKHERIVIVIGSAEKSHEVDNPFTAGERYEMIYKSMKLNLMDLKSTHIIPVRDINRSNLYVKHIETMCPKFDLVYSRNKLITYLFNEAGYVVPLPPIYYAGTVMDERLNSTNLRKMMASTYLDCMDGIPKGTIEVLNGIKAKDRINNMRGEM